MTQAFPTLARKQNQPRWKNLLCFGIMMMVVIYFCITGVFGNDYLFKIIILVIMLCHLFCMGIILLRIIKSTDMYILQSSDTQQKQNDTEGYNEY